MLSVRAATFAVFAGLALIPALAKAQDNTSPDTPAQGAGPQEAPSQAQGAPPADSFTLPDVAGIGVLVTLAPGEKCQRCWRVLTEVGPIPAHSDLCHRCAGAIDSLALAGQ